MRRKLTGVLLMLAIAAPAVALAGAKWQKDSTKKGVTIYTRAVEGSPYLDVKGVGTVDAQPEDVFEFLVDHKNMKKLSKGLKEVKVLGSCGENCKYIYERVGQGPVTDRQYIIEQRWAEKGDQTWKIWWKVSKKKKPKASDAITVTKHSGSWHISPKDGKTKIVYRNFIDVGGKIPVAFVNSGTVGGAFKFYFNLRKHI